ncbi:unnamed protein product [Notodromas monacha]|uniref:Secreted protein n=1 Tax=Notodromas monacha TaxID=399045 RepID=A0A7R9BNB0_9CRUS|nr:unnamed protein product [Notodromas monacha]CAG0917829.1 unnamed protein product [Notodromas monacha]
MQKGICLLLLCAGFAAVGILANDAEEQKTPETACACVEIFYAKDRVDNRTVQLTKCLEDLGESFDVGDVEPAELREDHQSTLVRQGPDTNKTCSEKVADFQLYFATLNEEESAADEFSAQLDRCFYKRVGWALENGYVNKSGVVDEINVSFSGLGKEIAELPGVKEMKKLLVHRAKAECEDKMASHCARSAGPSTAELIFCPLFADEKLSAMRIRALLQRPVEATVRVTRFPSMRAGDLLTSSSENFPLLDQNACCRKMG